MKMIPNAVSKCSNPCSSCDNGDSQANGAAISNPSQLEDIGAVVIAVGLLLVFVLLLLFLL